MSMFINTEKIKDLTELEIPILVYTEIINDFDERLQRMSKVNKN